MEEFVIPKTPARLARERREIEAYFDAACDAANAHAALVEAVIKNHRSVLNKADDDALEAARDDADRLVKNTPEILGADFRIKQALASLRTATIMKHYRAQDVKLTRLSENSEEWARNAVAGGWCAPRPAYSGNVIAFPWRERIVDDAPMSPALRRRHD